ncbi:MAG: bifunctional demethylmenaquinone methyltransferase/2-methoxy-6-polyprenyl-1,4-benzoquinol methylase UbiE [Bacteroidales bacterium]|nr:bifunctional demethylmenaquinone methyltransferase/2-methoxy-6-polyprenyl-1,4-benzoquinol methylase UbiE [Bacteroidales bacterium]
MAVIPYKNSQKSKKDQIEKMFDDISHKYDFLNHLLSLNIDKLWRKNAIGKLKVFSPQNILDVATGTADFAIAATRIENAVITGIDISEGMLGAGRIKVDRKKLTGRIELLKADSENLPFDNNTFDAATIGFGIRNFENPAQGLSEILRVLKPGGVIVILEFSKHVKQPFKQLYSFYFTKILPLFGKIISKNGSAYTYLPESVKIFPDGNDFIEILYKAGFVEGNWYLQTFGIASIYLAKKAKI